MKADPPDQRLQRARIQLILDEPFFGTLLMRLKPRVTQAVKTFSTDTKSLFVNPDFLKDLNDAELHTILAHEVLHCALLHPFRRGERDHRKFNIAADYAINNFLEDYNEACTKRGARAPFVFTGPLKNGCLDRNYADLSAEEIYARLIDPPPQGGGGGAGSQQGGTKSKSKGQGQSSAGDNSPSPGGEGRGEGEPSDAPSSPGEFTDGAADEAQAQQGEADWKVALKQAAMAAKGQGKLPASLAQLIEEFLEPKATWQDLLRNFLTGCCTDDYTWTRPNRRYSGGGIILPSLHSPRLGTVVVAVDTSGSVYCKAQDFFSEARAILFECRPEKLIFIQCDAKVHEVVEIQADEDFPVRQARGGGGTDFRPVFERVAEEPEPPAALVFLTDLYGDFPASDPGYPVIWAAINDQQAPFGTTIQIE